MESGVLQKEAAEVSSENDESSKFYSKTEEILENTNADGLSEIRKILVQGEEVGEVLPSALQKRAKKDKKLTEAILAGSLALILLIGGFFYIRDYRRWADYLERLNNEPGIVVTEAKRGFFKHKIEGLGDEMAANPETILADYGYESDDVKSIWKNYQDLNPQFVLERAKKILNPPTIRLTLEDGILTARGTAENSWYLDARNIAKGMARISTFKVARE